MFNKKIGLILVLALAAGLGLLAAQKFFGPVTPATRWPATQTVTLFPQARPLPPFSHLAGLALLLGLAPFAFRHAFSALTLGMLTTGVLILVAVWEWRSLHRGSKPAA